MAERKKRNIEEPEYQVYVSNIVADFGETFSATLSPEHVAGLLNNDLIWEVWEEGDHRSLVLATLDGEAVAEWPIPTGQASYQTLPARPTLGG